MNDGLTLGEVVPVGGINLKFGRRGNVFNRKGA